MTIASKLHMGRVKALPCIVCQQMGMLQSGPTLVHHIGDTTHRSDWLTVPLCHDHHQGPLGFHGLGEREFNRRYRTDELRLLAETLGRLGART